MKRSRLLVTHIVDFSHTAVDRAQELHRQALVASGASENHSHNLLDRDLRMIMVTALDHSLAPLDNHVEDRFVAFPDLYAS